MDFKGLQEDIRLALIRDGYKDVIFDHEEREELEIGEGNPVCFNYTAIDRSNKKIELSVETDEPTEVFPVWERSIGSKNWLLEYDLTLSENVA